MDAGGRCSVWGGDPAGEMKRVLSAVGLAVDPYNFGAIDALPVRGSSTHLGSGRGSVHWDPVPRMSSFNPTQRWRGWDASARELFSAVEGAQLSRLGYEG